MGLEGGTIFLGRGTANKNIFDYLGLNDKKKEIVLIIGYSSTIKKAGQYICQKLEFEKAHRGIAYVENILIEPEKEIVLILSEKENTKNVVDAITKELNIEEPGKGIMFVTNVIQTYGLVK